MIEASPSKLPQPQGYNILCALPEVQKTHGDTEILKADKTIQNETVLATVLFVLKVGPDAYKDTTKFSYPWCKEGDFVVVRPNSGTRLKVFGTEFRLITDDQVEAVVDDPRGISRA